MITNKHKVNKKLWSGMSDTGRLVFNDVYENVLNQNFMVHPKVALQTAEEWKTVAHNAACYAAWAHDNLTPKFHPKERHEAILEVWKNEAGNWHARLSATDFKHGSAIFESMAMKTKKAAKFECECAAALLGWVIID